MARIVLIHGIAQEQKAADVLEAEWLPALAGGARTGGFPSIADRIWRDRQSPGGIETRMAFYGHLFLRPDIQGESTEGLTDEEAKVAEELAFTWLEHGVDRATRPSERAIAARELAFLQGQVGEEVMGLRSARREVFKSLARLRWFGAAGMVVAERLVWKSAAQVTKYLTDEESRRKVQVIVSDLVGPETEVIIGHSLGSVIAYEVAQQLEHPLSLLVTLGSPLGLDTVIYPRLRPQPPGFPCKVKRWVNVADRDDLIAAKPDLTGMFSQGIPSGARFEGGYIVENGAQPHSAVFYLTKAKTGRPIGETLAVSP